MTKIIHLKFMQHALSLAKRGTPGASPNPLVGCVIVNNSQIVGEGFHERYGCAHAEVNALSQAKELARKATVYITLEPCCHYGKTPPCTDALIAAGVKKIYVACLDPNPQVSGKGIALLRAANIQVEVGLAEQEAMQLNEAFFYYMHTRLPFVIAKWAMSFDGQTVTASNDSCNISCQESHIFAHGIRSKVDAILIGANTARLDNPLLTARLGKNKMDKQPLRIILSSRGDLPLDLQIFSKELPGKTLVVTSNAISKTNYKKFIAQKIEVLSLPANNNHQVDLVHLLQILGKQAITSLLVEGGMQVLQQFFAENLVNKVQVYLAPVIIASLQKKHRLHNTQLIQIDSDFYFSADYKEQSCLLALSKP